jgi:hypothetical protein
MEVSTGWERGTVDRCGSPHFDMVRLPSDLVFSLLQVLPVNSPLHARGPFSFQPISVVVLAALEVCSVS